MADIKDKYSVAINDKGYMLRGAPDKVGYARSIIPSQVERMAVSDLAYSDFAGQGLFYLAQTDWNAGIKHEKVWRDDAKFYYSTNIDAYSQQGVLQLSLDVVQAAQSIEQVTCGVYGPAERVNGTIATEWFVGTADPSDGPAFWYKSTQTGAWSYESPFTIVRSMITQMLLHKNKIFMSSAPVGTDATLILQDWYQGSPTDHSAAIHTAMGWASNATGSRCMCEIGSTLYVGLDIISSNLCGVVKTDDAGATWAKLFDKHGKHFIADMVGYGSGIYYLLDTNDGQGGLELRYYDLTADTDVLINRFPGGCAWREWTSGAGTEYIDTRGTGGRYLFVFQGKLIITVPMTKSDRFAAIATNKGEIWEYDGTTLQRIFTVDSGKNAIGATASSVLYYGGCEHKGRLFWTNLIYDGEAFYNDVKPHTDGTGLVINGLFSDGSLLHYAGALGNHMSRIKREVTNTYRSTADKNFAVFSEMSPVSKIDKLFNGVTIIFDKMDVGESIKVEYSIDNMDSWVSVGTRAYSATDSTTKKEWLIPRSVNFNKIWFKVYLNSDGSSTPKLTDFIMSYRPMPDYKNRWDMRLNFSESVSLLNRQQEQRSGQELNAELWNEKVTKQTVVFQDIDYIKCDLVSAMAATDTSALVDNTKRFPRQGRIRAVSGSVAEEMTYTSAQTNKLLGISRAKRGTAARAYAAAQQLDNGYDVYIEDIRSEVNFTDEKKTEHIAQVSLIES